MHSWQRIHVRCTCGQPLSLEVHSVVDVASQPEVLAQIRNGRFHQATCAYCGRHVQLEKWFLLRTGDGSTIVHVFPKAYRLMYWQLRKQLVRLHKLCGVHLRPEAVQIVFSLDELLRLLQKRLYEPPIVAHYTGLPGSTITRH